MVGNNKKEAVVDSGSVLMFKLHRENLNTNVQCNTLQKISKTRILVR